MKENTIISDEGSLVCPPAKSMIVYTKPVWKSWANGQTWRSPWGRGPRIPATAFWPHVWWSAEGLWKMNSSLHWSNPFSGFFLTLVFTSLSQHFGTWTGVMGLTVFVLEILVENHKMFWVFSLAFHHQYWISVDSNALCVSGSLRYNDSSEVFLLLFLLPTATERQREKTVHRKKRVSLSFEARWFQGAIPGRLTIFFLSGGRNYTVILLPRTPPFIFSGVFIDEEMQSKKLGAISLEEFLWIFPLYLFDCSRGVATNYYWRLMALEKNVLLSSPWVVYQFLGSRVTFYFFDVCYLTLSGPIGVVSSSWMQVGAEVDATYTHNVMMKC